MTITTDTAADTAAVAGVPGRIVAAWAGHDAGAFADVFTEDGTMILPGLYLKGRQAIRDFMVEAFQGAYNGTQVTGQPIDLRFLTPDSALVVTQGGVLSAGQTELSAEELIRATWVIARVDGEWQLAAYHNCPATPADAAQS
jgi:uncharacterized protein (TIGR02246 family)